MIYLEYHALKQRYKDAVAMVDSILLEKEELFSRTQPNAVRYDGDRVKTSHTANTLDEYVIALSQRHIEERLAEADKIMQDRKRLLKEKEGELRESKEVEDVVYRCRYIDRLRIRKIRQITHYSDAQIYRIIDKIRKELSYETEK